MIPVNTDALEAHILTVTQRIFGVIHPTAGAAVAEFLNRSDRALLPVTGAKIYLSRFPYPPVAPELVEAASFFAIPKDQIVWVKSGHFNAGLTREYQTQRVEVHFEGCRVAGEMRVPQGARLSDHLEMATRYKPFQRLHRAVVTAVAPGRSGDPAGHLASGSSDVVTVNLRNAHGIAEPTEMLQEA